MIFGVEEAHIEVGIVGDIARTIKERCDFLRDIGEYRFVSQKCIGDSMHCQRVGMHLATIGVDEQVQPTPCRELVFELDAADLDNPVNLVVETRGFRIKNNLAHLIRPSLSSWKAQQQFPRPAARPLQAPARYR